MHCSPGPGRGRSPAKSHSCPTTKTRTVESVSRHCLISTTKGQSVASRALPCFRWNRTATLRAKFASLGLKSLSLADFRNDYRSITDQRTLSGKSLLALADGLRSLKQTMNPLLFVVRYHRQLAIG